MIGGTGQIFLQSLRAIPIAEIPSHVLARQKKAGSCMFEVHTGISPYTLYCYLNARFGPPNGITTFTKNRNTTSNLVHWHYTLLSGENELEVWALSTRIEMLLSGYEKIDPDDWKSFLEAIKMDMRNYSPQLRAFRAQLDKWTVFLNPYYRLERTVRQLASDLQALEFDKRAIPEPPAPWQERIQEPDSEDYLDTWTARLNELSLIYHKAQTLSASLRMLVSVWAESFINFVIFILRKDRLKEAENMIEWEEYRRGKITTRLERLHEMCDIVIKPIDTEAEDYKAFHTLMNERNDILHGNVDPNLLQCETIYFDGHTPVWMDQPVFGVSFLEKNMTGIEPAVTLSRVETVDRFIAFVINHLEEEFRPMMVRAMENSELGWCPAKKIVSVLFENGQREGFLTGRVRTSPGPKRKISSKNLTTTKITTGPC